MFISDLTGVMEKLAPPELAEGWDNVGLLVGNPAWVIEGPVLLTIDLTEAVLQEAVQAGSRAIVAYHPPIFHAAKRIVDGPGSPMSQRIVLRAIEAGIAVYSPHTALDAVTGGISDWLADGLLDSPGALGTGGDRRALRPFARTDPNAEVKIVTFVPESQVEQVRGALASAGAGHIGGYELCSFASPGTGTFFGGPGTSPAVGQAGRLENIQEVRLEMVCPRRAVSLAIATLKQFHPYDEPAIDVYPLEPRVLRDFGVGRRITLDQSVSLEELAGRLKRHLRVGGVLAASVSGSLEETMVQRIGVVPGAGGSVFADAAAAGCELFVTGELKHHEVKEALEAGVSVLLGGHTATERGYLPILAEKIASAMPGVNVLVSRADRDPLVFR